MKTTVMLECPKCNYTDLVKERDLKYTNKDCETCNLQYTVTKYEDITDAGIILDIIDMELENRNYHSLNNLPQDLYSSLRTSDNDFDTAKKIANVLDKNLQ